MKVISLHVFLPILVLEIILLLIILLFDQNPISKFETGYLISIFSFIQLLVISLLSWRIFRNRNKLVGLSGFKSSHTIWIVIAIGFLILSISEVTQLHERIDKFIHILFSLEKTELTTHIDNCVIGLSAIIGLCALRLYVSEIKVFNGLLNVMLISSLFIFAMLFTDTLISFQHIAWLNVLEEAFKVCSEGILIVGFFICYKQVKNQIIN